MEKLSTRERILEAALDLFSQRGYDGVGVDQIADAVGIRGPSLYHYFKGKEEILRGLIDCLEAHYGENFGTGREIAIPDSLEELEAQSMGRLAFTIHDPRIRKVRRLLSMEQFRNETLRHLATEHFFTGLHRLYTVIFAGMQEKGLLVPGDAALLALEFVAPVSMMVHLCDREPEREPEAMAWIEAHMKHFFKQYGRK